MTELRLLKDSENGLIQNAQSRQIAVNIPCLRAHWKFITNAHVSLLCFLRLLIQFVRSSKIHQVHWRLNHIVLILRSLFKLVNRLFGIVTFQISIAQCTRGSRSQQRAVAIKIFQLLNGILVVAHAQVAHAGVVMRKVGCLRAAVIADYLDEAGVLAIALQRALQRIFAQNIAVRKKPCADAFCSRGARYSRK